MSVATLTSDAPMQDSAVGANEESCAALPRASAAGGGVRMLLLELMSISQGFRSPAASESVSGIGATGAEKLTGRGDFNAITGPGTIRFQAAYVAPEVMATITQQLKRGVAGSDIIASSVQTPVAERTESRDGRSALESAIRALPRAGRA